MISISTPKLFNPKECLWFLDRGFDDCMHEVSVNTVTKAAYINSVPTLFKCELKENEIIISGLNRSLNQDDENAISDYISDWFDLRVDLASFYSQMSNDNVLYPLIKKYYGLTLVGINDLFESLCWAILGQQINLLFAYKIKRAFVMSYGESIAFNNGHYYLFPKPSVIAKCNPEALRSLQISKNKAQYIINLARAFEENRLSKTQLASLGDSGAIRSKLVELKGIGPWTAEYVMMKCLKIKAAFPAQDVGLHNAIKNQLGLPVKPTVTEVEKIAKQWKGWESYATLYLWRSLARAPGE